MYEKIKGFFPRTIDFVVFIILVLLALFGICVGIGTLYYHGAGTNPLGTQLEQAEHTQSSITGGVSDSRKETESLRGEMREVGESISRIRSDVASSRELIEDSQRILDGIRQRGKSQAKQN